MLAIVKKNLVFFAGYCGVVFILTAILRVALGVENAAPQVLIAGVMIFMLVYGALFFNEQYEEKHKAYDFLDTLPVSAGDIVSAKFGLVLAAVTATVGYMLLLFSLTKIAPNDWALVRSYLLLSGVVCLGGAALSYIGIFILSYTKFAVIVMSFVVLLGFVPVLVMKFYGDNMHVLIENILMFLRNVNWAAVIPLTLIGYFGLMLLAIKIKE